MIQVYGKTVLVVVQRRKNLKKKEEMARNRKERKEVDPETEGKDLARGRGKEGAREGNFSLIKDIKNRSLNTALETQ